MTLVACASPRMTQHVHSWCPAWHKRPHVRTNYCTTSERSARSALRMENSWPVANFPGPTKRHGTSSMTGTIPGLVKYDQNARSRQKSFRRKVSCVYWSFSSTWLRPTTARVPNNPNFVFVAGDLERRKELELKPETLLALVQFRATTHHGRVRSSVHDVPSNITSHPLLVIGYVNVIGLRSQTCISYSVISGNRLTIVTSALLKFAVNASTDLPFVLF